MEVLLPTHPIYPSEEVQIKIKGANKNSLTILPRIESTGTASVNLEPIFITPKNIGPANSEGEAYTTIKLPEYIRFKKAELIVVVDDKVRPITVRKEITIEKDEE